MKSRHRIEKLNLTSNSIAITGATGVRINIGRSGKTIIGTIAGSA